MILIFKVIRLMDHGGKVIQLLGLSSITIILMIMLLGLAFIIVLGVLDFVPFMDTEIDCSFLTAEGFIIHGIITGTTRLLLIIPIWAMSMDIQASGRQAPIIIGIHILIMDTDGDIP